jgi:hypothetical protein
VKWRGKYEEENYWNNFGQADSRVETFVQIAIRLLMSSFYCIVNLAQRKVMGNCTWWEAVMNLISNILKIFTLVVHSSK